MQSSHFMSWLTDKFEDIVSYQNLFYAPAKIISRKRLPEFNYDRFLEPVKLLRGRDIVDLSPIGKIEDFISKSYVPSFKKQRNRHDFEDFARDVCSHYICPQKTFQSVVLKTNPNFARESVIELLQTPFHFSFKSIRGLYSSLLGPESALRVGQDKLFFLSSKSPDVRKLEKSVNLITGRDNSQQDLDGRDYLREISYAIRDNGFSTYIDFFNKIPSHTIFADGLFFHFPSTFFKTSCTIVGRNSFFLNNFPRPKEKGYKHFFVYSTDNEVCYAGDDRFKRIGMVCDKDYLFEPDALSYKLARVIEQSLENLLNGYKQGCRPAQLAQNLLEFTKPASYNDFVFRRF